MAEIRGYVFEKYTRRPMLAAVVTIQETGEIARTDAKGKFVLNSVEQGRVSLIITADEHSTGRAVVEVEDPQGSYPVEIHMRPVVKAL